MEILRSIYQHLISSGESEPAPPSVSPKADKVGSVAAEHLREGGEAQQAAPHRFTPELPKASRWYEFSALLPWSEKAEFKPPTRAELRGMSIKELREVAKNQRNGLTLAQLTCLKPEQVSEILRLVAAKQLSLPQNKLDILKKMNLTTLSEQIPGRGADIFVRLETFDNLTPYKAAALLALPNVPHITGEQLTKINWNDVHEVLGDEGFNEVLEALSPKQLEAIAPALESLQQTQNPMPPRAQIGKVSGMSNAQINQLSKNDFEFLSVNFMDHLTPLQIRGLDATHVGYLSTQQIDQLARGNKLNYLSNVQLERLTPQQAARFSPTAINSLSKEKQDIVNEKILQFLITVVETTENQGVRNVFVNYDKVDAAVNLKANRTHFSPELVSDALLVESSWAALAHPLRVDPATVQRTQGLPDSSRMYAPGAEVAMAKSGAYTAAFTSTYPTETIEGKVQRTGDPIVDDALYATGQTTEGRRFHVLSATDGSDWVKPGDDAPLRAATQANQGYVDKAIEVLGQGVRTARELDRLPLQATLEARDRIQAKYDQVRKTSVDPLNVPKEGETVQAGVVIVETAPGRFLGQGSAVGDMSAYLVKKNGRVVELTRPTDVSQPPQIGGSRGLVLNNYNQFTFEAETGDSYIVMSDGVRDNLKPWMLHLSPRQVIEELKAAKFALTGIDRRDIAEIEDMDYPEIWNDPRNFKAQLEKLDDLYASYMLGVKLPRVAQEKGIPLSQAAVEFAREQNAARIQYQSVVPPRKFVGILQVQTETGKKPVVIKGKPDHVSFSQITL